MFNYKYAKLSGNNDDFNNYFIFQNGSIYQYNYLPINFIKMNYQLTIDVFNLTNAELNNKTNPFIYTCRIILNIIIQLKQNKNEAFYNLEISSTNITAYAKTKKERVVLKNFKNEDCFDLKMLNSEFYFELNSMTGDLILKNISNFIKSQYNNYNFKIKCQNNSTIIINVTIIDDYEPCLPTIWQNNSIVYYNFTINSTSIDLIQLPKDDIITQMIVNQCDQRNFNSRRFGFKILANDLKFYEYFYFNTTNGILKTNDSFINYTLLQTGSFKFNIQVFDLSNSSLNSTSVFELKININIISNESTNVEINNNNHVNFIQKFFIAEIEENSEIGTLINYLNQSLINDLEELNNFTEAEEAKKQTSV